MLGGIEPDMTSDRLEFFLDGRPVGFFERDEYPSRPGRYPYTPYRGEGHALLASALRRGETARCSFSMGRQQFSLAVVRDELVLDGPASRWFVDVSSVEDNDVAI